MSDRPSVVIGVHGGAADYASEGDVNVVLIDWDDLECDTATRGDYCRIWKKLWTLPEDLRLDLLFDLIDLVSKRFPIMAEFQPEEWVNDNAQPLGKPIKFDATPDVLLKDPAVVDNFRDNDYPTDDLAADLPERQAHVGPFMVRVKEAAMEFLFADENEAEDARKQA